MLITTERLKLRNFKEEDLGVLHRIWSDPVTIWWGPHTSIEESRRLLSRAIAEDWLAVEHDGVVIGDVYARPSEHDFEAVELGYHFVCSEWEKGFATEACRALLSTLGGHRVQAPIVPDNIRSRRVATKLGMAVVRQVTRGGLLHDDRLRKVSLQRALESSPHLAV